MVAKNNGVDAESPAAAVALRLAELTDPS